MRWPIAIALICALFAAVPDLSFAQDILSQARSAPTRADGLQLLETHLASQPDDVDARLLYGLMLSWEARYDDARRELQRVLTAAPGYTDARAALMNVEWWSGRTADAREHSNAILFRDPGHAAARLMRQRLDAADRPWRAGVSASIDTFSDGRDAWHEQALTVSRQTPRGPVIVRAGLASRFGLSDEQIELEFYPTLRPGTYAFVGVGVSPDHALYPQSRLAVDLYQAVGGGFEIAGGYRRLGFDDTVHMYVGSVSKYAGPWLLTGRLTTVDAGESVRELAGQLQARRYFGADGASYAGAGYIRGMHREEIRGEGDLAREGIDTFRGELNASVTRPAPPAARHAAGPRGARTRGAVAAILYGRRLGPILDPAALSRARSSAGRCARLPRLPAACSGTRSRPAPLPSTSCRRCP